MCCKGHKCSISVELQMTAQTVSFQEINRIRNSRVTAIMAHWISGDEPNYSPTDRLLTPNQYMGSSYLTLVNSNGTEIVSKINLRHLQRGYDDQEPIHVNWTNIDLTQSSVMMATSAWDTLDDVSTSIMLEFFLDCNDCGVPE